MYRYRTAFTEGLPLDINLHVDGNGEPLTPFALYVAPTTPLPNLPATFHRWSDLPDELQLNIYKFCDASTLFRLMQTCANTRAEAEKLFWSDPAFWYPIRGDWLVNGGIPCTHYPAAASRLQQIEIALSTMNLHLDPNDHDPDPQHYRFGTIEDLSSARKFSEQFWGVFQRSFPSARRVIFDEIFPETPWRLSPSLITIARACPSTINIQVSGWKWSDPTGTVSILRRRKHLRRIVEAADHSYQWEVVQGEETRRRISMPPGASTGPVGTWQNHLFRERTLLQKQRGIRALRLETVERYHFGGRNRIPFRCPLPACPVGFEEVGDWTLHAIQSEHDQMEMSTQSGGVAWAYRAVGAVPQELERPFQEKEKWLGRVAAGLRVEKRNMQDAYGKTGSVKRRRFREAFLAQLVNDPAYKHDYSGNQLSATGVWHSYQKMVEDPHWIES